MQPNTEISHRSSNLFSATEVAETIGTDLETINEWLEVGAIDRALFGGGRFSKYELQRAALTFEMVKLGLAPSRARDVVWKWSMICNKFGKKLSPIITKPTQY